MTAVVNYFLGLDLGQAADYSAAELDHGFHDLLKLEEQIKLGELDARLAVEGFILEQVLGAAR